MLPLLPLRILKTKLLPIAASALLTLSLASRVFAADICEGLEEKMAEMYAKVADNDFNVERDLRSYSELLPALPELLNKLGPKNHWLDIGAGNMAQLSDYYFWRESTTANKIGLKRGKPAQVTAINVAQTDVGEWRSESLAKKQPGFKHELGYFEKIPQETLRPADLVTDVYGGFSYTTELTTFLTQLGTVMKPGAHFLAKAFPPIIVGKGRKKISFEAFIRDHCKGFEVVSLKGSKREAAEIHLQRTGEPVVIGSLELTDMTDGRPGLRFYKLSN